MRHRVLGFIAGIAVLALLGVAAAGAATGAPDAWSTWGSHMFPHAGMMSSSNPGGMMGTRHASGMMGTPSQRARFDSPLTIDQAVRAVKRYANFYGNSHLVIDEVLEFQHNFYAIVKDTSTGHGAFEVLVNKWTGVVLPEYGPAMMWNTQYGMMRGGMMGYRRAASRPMTISLSEAARIARQWLAQHRPGVSIETPDQFPGYYTVHFRMNGRIAGMLSVNGYTGQVWFHTWHGAFIRMKTVAG